MKKIVYIVPYFGKIPDFFNMWLLSCSYNPTIDWIILTDDKGKFSYPSNVHVFYMSFEELKNKIQSKYDFPIELPTPYRLCDYKVAYGDIFTDIIQNYDYWGFCDIDMFWGNIRNFITENRLLNYDRIGYLGHSTIFRNTPEINTLYKKELDGRLVYRDIFMTSGNVNCFFDEHYIGLIFDKYKKRTCEDLIFADLMPWSPKFMLSYAKGRNMAKNRNRIFTWKNGHVYSHSIIDEQIEQDEFMYIHFLKRDMAYPNSYSSSDEFLIVPNRFIPKIPVITSKLIRKYSSRFIFSFWWSLFVRNRNKITLARLKSFFRGKIKESRKINRMIKEAEFNEID